MPRFVLMFIVITFLAAMAIWLYSLLLGMVEHMLSGDRDWTQSHEVCPVPEGHDWDPKSRRYRQSRRRH